MNIFEKVLTLVSSFKFCLKVMPLRDALVVPCQIPWNMRLIIGHGAKVTILAEKKHRYMVKLGFIGAKLLPPPRPQIIMRENSKIEFKGNAIFGDGISICIEENVTLKVGEDFYCNSNCLFRCADNVTLDDKVLFGWNVSLNTSDGHLITIDDVTKPNHGPIHIGKHTWIASNATLCKSVTIGNDCIVAQQSLVNHSFEGNNLLIGGIPAKALRKNVKRID